MTATMVVNTSHLPVCGAEPTYKFLRGEVYTTPDCKDLAMPGHGQKGFRILVDADAPSVQEVIFWRQDGYDGWITLSELAATKRELLGEVFTTLICQNKARPMHGQEGYRVVNVACIWDIEKVVFWAKDGQNDWITVIKLAEIKKQKCAAWHANPKSRVLFHARQRRRDGGGGRYYYD